MNKHLLAPTTLMVALLTTVAAPVQSETIRTFVSEQSVQAQTQTPQRGQTAEHVRGTYGEPAKIQPPVGEPPISVWSYDQFTVYFERNTVIRTVLHHKSTE